MSSFFSKSHKSQLSSTSLDYRYPMQSGVPSQSNGLGGGNMGPSPRTPSPTPSEAEELKKGAIDWQEIMNWRNWAKRKYIGTSRLSLTACAVPLMTAVSYSI